MGLTSFALRLWWPILAMEILWLKRWEFGEELIDKRICLGAPKLRGKFRQRERESNTPWTGARLGLIYYVVLVIVLYFDAKAVIVGGQLWGLSNWKFIGSYRPNTSRTWAWHGRRLDIGIHFEHFVRYHNVLIAWLI